MKNLIINADDFGMSAEVNEGVKMGIEAGVINNVSLMVNLPFFNDAVEYLRSRPEISVGLHFNITEGRPVSSPAVVGSLLREDNYFYHWQSLLPRLLIHEAKINHIEEELLAQALKLKETGLPISHIDSHHHIHLYPNIFKMVTKFADKEGIPSLRCHHFSLWSLTAGVNKRPTFKQLVVNFLLWWDSFFYNHKHLYEIDGIYDLNWDENLADEELINILDHLPEGKTELICHVGVLSKTGNRKFLEPRLKKLELLTRQKIKDRILKSDVCLFSRNSNLH